MKDRINKLKAFLLFMQWIWQVSTPEKVIRVVDEMPNGYNHLSDKLLNDKKYNSFRFVSNIVIAGKGQNCMSFEIDGDMFIFYRKKL